MAVAKVAAGAKVVIAVASLVQLGRNINNRTEAMCRCLNAISNETIILVQGNNNTIINQYHSQIDTLIANLIKTIKTDMGVFTKHLDDVAVYYEEMENAEMQKAKNLTDNMF